MADEGSDLDVVEVGLVDGSGDDGLAAVPRHFELGVFFMDVLCEDIDPFRIVVASHEGDAGDVVAILTDEVVDGTVQLSHSYMTTGKTIALTRRTFVGKVTSLLFNMLSRLLLDSPNPFSTTHWRTDRTF